MEQDKGYAWVILVASFLNNAITASVFVSPAVYMVDWMAAFDTTKAEVAVVGSLMATVACCFGLFTAPLISNFGYRRISVLGGVCGAFSICLCTFAQTIRQLYLFFGVFLGISHSMYYLPPILVTQFYFKKRRALASGISLSGHSTGTFIFMPILRQLIRFYGWRGAMLIHAGIVLNITVLGSLYRPVLTDDDNGNGNKSTESNSEIKSSILLRPCIWIKRTWQWSLFKNPAFVLFLLSSMFSQYSVDISYKFTGLKSVAVGDLNRVQASFIPSVIGLTSTICRVLISFVANLKFVNRTIILASAILCHSIGCIATTFAYDVTTYSIAMVICGVGIGSQMTVMITTLVDLIGVGSIVNAQSFFSLSSAITFSTCLTFAGFLVDTTSNYDLPYYIYGCIGILASGIMYIVNILQKSGKENENRENTFAKTENGQENKHSTNMQLKRISNVKMMEYTVSLASLHQ